MMSLTSSCFQNKNVSLMIFIRRRNKHQRVMSVILFAIARSVLSLGF